jgi:hypothetical protein
VPMVRIGVKPSTNLRVYGSKCRIRRNAYTADAGCVRFSKICPYEKPYYVTGIVKHTGLKQAPKGICIDRFIGTWEAGKWRGQ